MAVRPLTPVGRKIKMKLVELDMTQKEYCESKGFNIQCFGIMLRSNEQHRNLLRKVCEDLNIEM